MKYYLLKCEVKSSELNEKNYGILMLDDDNNREYSCDISDFADDVAILVDKMNSYNIGSHQAKEIIEDFKFNKK